MWPSVNPHYESYAWQGENKYKFISENIEVSTYKGVLRKGTKSSKFCQVYKIEKKSGTRVPWDGKFRKFRNRCRPYKIHKKRCEIDTSTP